MKLFYRKLGEGKPLFILHGLLGLSDNWATIGKLLSDSFEVYLIDLRNHGNSPHSDEWTYPAMAEDIKELMDDVLGMRDEGKTTSTISHQPSAILIGHSLGGKVAMQFASMHPEKLEKLIVVDMAPKNYSGSSFDFAHRLLSINLSEMKTRKEAEEKLLTLINEKSELQLMQKNIYWNDRNNLAWKFNLKAIAENINKIKNTFSLGEKLINTSTLFICGEKSNYILDSDIPEIKKIFPNSEFKTITDAGHWVHADKPKEFAECVKEFIL